jgi:hypothetical protein
LQELRGKIAENLQKSSSLSKSKENWREEIQDFISEKNKSPEVCVERSLAKSFKNNGLQNWWNQMPIASGLVSANSDRRRAIDLVHRNEKTGAYDLIELKIDSDSPVYALIEIVLYGLVYLVLRDNPRYLSDKSKQSRIFRAREINLLVLAPHEYFNTYELGGFEQELNIGFQTILANREDGLTMRVKSYSHPTLKKQIEKHDSFDGILNLDTWEKVFP